MRIESLIVHSLPGRVRLRVNHKAVVRRFSASLERFLSTRPGTTGVRTNASCGSIIVNYESDSLDPESLADDISRFLRALVIAPALARRATVTVTATSLATSKSQTWGDRADSGYRDAGGAAAGTVATQRLPRPWHGVEVDEVVRLMRTDTSNGLDAADASDRLQQYGENSLGEIAQRSGWDVLASQFISLPVALLFGSAVVSVTTAGFADAIVILGVVAINACIGWVTESQAERTIASLQDQPDFPATVIRRGVRHSIPVEWVVPGDVVLITPGMSAPADLRLIQTQRLMMDESALTGESLPVSKSSAALIGRKVALRDRCNMAYRGTVVTSGSGVGISVATGSETEVGRIQSLVGAAKPPETPVQRQLRELGTTLGLLTGSICGGIFGLGLLRRYEAIEMLKSATSLAVAAVPEGLPVVATTTLALGVNRMRRLNVAVRRLDAVETLGSVQIICLDKTGTLTRNQMRVVRLYVGDQLIQLDGSGDEFDAETLSNLDRLRRFLEVAVLCNEADVVQYDGKQVIDGSPTEAALIRLALDSQISIQETRAACPLLRTEYRTERRGYMTTTHQLGNRRRLLAVKGRPSDVLELCRWKLVGNTSVEMTAQDRDAIRRENEIMAGRSLRVLAFAFREVFSGNGSGTSDLTWLGLAGIADPIRPGMRELMQTFHRAGIRTTMITGDQSATAHAIGRELDLGDGPELRTMDSTELETIEPEVLKSLAENVHVFSSVTPTHKLEIVRALQRAGLVVAMTGDGINDGPALKAADIGVAMGGAGAANVARMTSDVVLEDNNLQSMVTAICQGRAIYSNTQKAIGYLLATNMSEIMVMFVGIASGAGSPLNPMQLLWLNLVSDIFPVLALAVQSPEPDVLDHPPRGADDPFLDRRDLRRMLMQSSVISVGTIGSYAWGRSRYRTADPASTMAFMSITAAQLLHMFSAQSERRSIFSAGRSSTNPWIILGFGAAMGLQLLTVANGPLRRLLHNAPLSPLDGVVSLLGAALPFFAIEAIKASEIQQRSPVSSLDSSQP